ncbi:unnamed protein product [Bursaphelenchus okinawaensis]|uniref:Uncharacterized protein n=1 Tax=Bursaphelenchus okinawaensis TaxID=465554 RepID=A0A811LUH8_9BILA|nr:unnamed protein product [Bursaphelenchus okinawaensis]CAG9128281.1 unnamed protein product [Bursaphelenchus okinawaensis]
MMTKLMVLLCCLAVVAYCSPIGQKLQDDKKNKIVNPLSHVQTNANGVGSGNSNSDESDSKSNEKDNNKNDKNYNNGKTFTSEECEDNKCYNDDGYYDK